MSKLNYNGNGDFKMKTAEFRGYTLRALEEINQELIEIKTNIKENTLRIDKLNNKISLIQGKIAGIGAVAGVAASLILHYLLM